MGAAKSHFGPILGPLGCQYTFLGLIKASIQGSAVLFLRQSRALKKIKNGEWFPTLANLELKKSKNVQKRPKTPLFGPFLTPFARVFLCFLEKRPLHHRYVSTRGPKTR